MTVSKVAFATLIGTLTLGVLAGRALAQESDHSQTASQPFAEDEATNGAAPGQGSPAAAPQKPATDPNQGWHFSVSPYLWLAGMHGSAGANGHQASVHAGFGDIFHNLNMGLMATAEARYNKVGIPLDFIWMKLSDEKASPFEVGPASAKAIVNQTMLTPKVAYRIVNGRAVTVDGNFGIRYLHLGTTLELEPTETYRSFYQSANWVDCVGGAKIGAALTPKLLVTVLGDAGAGGANLDYQLAGVLGYAIKPNMILQGAWRYMDVNYRPSSGFVYDMTTSGVLIGVTLNLK